MAEEYVTTLIARPDHPGSAREDIGHGTAHTSDQMRRALDHHAKAVLTLIPQIVSAAATQNCPLCGRIPCLEMKDLIGA
jgi:hypothetical protein